MWRKAAGLLVVAGIALMPALSWGSASHAHAASTIQVKPASGSPGTHFTVSIQAPVETGPYSTTSRRYEASVSGPSGRSGCVSNASVQFPVSAAHAELHVVLSPATFDGKWCVGTFRGQIELLQTSRVPAARAVPGVRGAPRQGR